MGESRAWRWTYAVAVASLTLSTALFGLPTPARAANDRVFMVSDSLTTCESMPPSGVAQEQAFLSAGWHEAHVSAYPSRGIVTAIPADPYRDGLQAIDALRARYGDATTWVVALGTNDSLRWPASDYASLIRRTLDRIGGSRKVLWVNVYNPLFPAQTTAWNRSLRSIADARPSQLTVFEWQRYVVEHGVPTDGGVHYTPQGCAIRNRVIAEMALDHLGPYSSIPDWQPYTVKAGDTLYGIASKTRTPINTLLSLNGLTLKSLIYPGMILKVGGGGSTPASTTTTTTPPDTTPGQTTTYTVKAGDTLYGIASKTRTPINTLLSLNGLSLKSLIYPGMVLKVGGGSTPASTTTTTTPPDTTPGQTTTYTVKAGDTLYGIASKTATPINTLLGLNGLTLKSLIYPGMILKVVAQT